MNTQSVSRTMTDDEFIVQIHDAHDSAPVDAAEFITPDMMGEMDAADGLDFTPEMYYADRAKQTLYAAGWASVKGPSYLTDAFLVGDAVESIEDDYQWIARGC